MSASLFSPPCGGVADVRVADYAVVIIMAVFVFASVSWMVSARKWFTGPIVNVDDSRTASFDEKHGSQ